MKNTHTEPSPEDTIVAVATAQGEGGINIIRISGPAALNIADGVFVSKNNRSVCEMDGYSMAYGKIVNSASGEEVDEGIVSVMRAPRSYTKEDVAEINCHGGPVAAKRVLEAVLEAGARLASPGEFTKRAYINGRIDLAQAEAVIDVIRARTDRASRQALRQLEGGLSEAVSNAEGVLLEALAQTEAAVDFSDEDLYIVPRDSVMKILDTVVKTLDNLLKGSGEGEIVRGGVRLAIVGRPNVGKSSLLNALLQRSRAIVTATPGTTRDTIEEALSISGIAFVVVDTAGIRHSIDDAETQGIALARKSINEADIVLCVVDASTGLTPEDEAVISLGNSKPLILAANKCDLIDEPLRPNGYVYVSATEALGLNELKEACLAAALSGTVGGSEDVLVSNARHTDALRRASRLLANATEALRSGLSEEFASGEIRGALDALGEISGRSVSADILDSIFSSFCIGK